MVTSPNPDHAPALSVVLPVLNEARDIGRLLGEIMEQTTPAGGFEVLVVDGGSTDDTRDIVADFCNRLPNCRLLDNPRKRSGAGRNVGIRAARGKYILFLDGHCALPRSDYFVRTVELFDSTKAACLCRPQPLNRLTEGEWAKAISAARHSLLGHNPASDIYGGWPAFTDPSSAGAAYLRTCIESLGGYDERFDACEDVEFNCRVAAADLPAYRHPDLTVQYRPRST
ncbi:MAG: glycosyltransferase, partial [Candidatus Eisenbacteria sp.]|nr:glycosyltransferase [Candidatus Eisenbacteria bacterium]